MGPTQAELVSALNNGVSPIGANLNGTSFMVKAVTTLSTINSVKDYRCREWHKATVPDFYADAVYAMVQAQYQGKDIGDDPPAGALPPPATVITPTIFKASINRITDDFAEDGQLQHVDAIKAATVVQRETSPSTRMSARVPLEPIDIFDQAAIQVDQIA